VRNVDLPLDSYWVAELVQATVGRLSERAPVATVRVLANALRRCVEVVHPKHDGDDEDYSYIWAPYLSGRGRTDSTEETLIAALTLAVDSISKSRPELTPDVTTVLREHDRKVFRRIELRLLAQASASAPTLVGEWLERYPEVFGDTALRYEISTLARAAFGQLPADVQERVITRITAGPNEDLVKRIFERPDGPPAKPEEVKEFRDEWVRDRLDVIAAFLPGHARERLDALVRERGAATPVEENRSGVGAVWSGPTSPVDAEKFVTLTPEEISEFLRTWKPPGGFEAPTPEGLGRTLESAVSQRPQEFGAATNLFKLPEPTYVRAVIDGLASAAENAREIPWEPVLSFCEWVIQQSGSRDVRPAPWDADPDWAWAKSAVARLLESGVRRDLIPIARRGIVWSVIVSRFDDPDPTPDDDAKDGMDALTRSLNCARGRAMNAVMEYALWLRRAGDRDPSAGVDPMRGFDDMPEVRDLLERRLDPSVEPAAAVRVVYGRYFPFLVTLDRNWAAAHADSVFNQLRDRLGRAAWEGYAFDGRVYAPVFEVLRAQYAAAVEALGSWEAHRGRGEDIDRRLASDLLRLYSWGRLTIEEPSSVLARFFIVAPEDLRRSSLESFGFMLARAEERVPDEVVARLQRLWAWRRDAAARVAARGMVEASAFGAWFEAKCLPLTWRLQELQALLSAGIEPVREFEVVEVLAEIAPTRTAEAVQLLRGLVANSSKLWFVEAHRADVRKVLEAGRVSQDAGARRDSDAVVGMLAARGYTEFSRKV
jgi:hypothetical protein